MSDLDRYGVEQEEEFMVIDDKMWGNIIGAVNTCRTGLVELFLRIILMLPPFELLREGPVDNDYRYRKKLVKRFLRLARAQRNLQSIGMEIDIASLFAIVTALADRAKQEVLCGPGKSGKNGAAVDPIRLYPIGIRCELPAMNKNTAQFARVSRRAAEST